MQTSQSRYPVKTYTIHAHPYAFDGLFLPGDRWTGSGYVKVHNRGGGVNEAWALVDADNQGYQALKSAGFAVRRVEQDSTRSAKPLRSAAKGSSH